tara:strand:- start:218 stop:418 length:201 start_codon:yes stop_codon:yes gene_type:complete
MGEAKRRKELGLPPKSNKKLVSKSNQNIIPWSKASINKLKSQFPAAPFVTTALVLLILQMGFSLNG